MEGNRWGLLLPSQPELLDTMPFPTLYSEKHFVGITDGAVEVDTIKAYTHAHVLEETCSREMSFPCTVLERGYTVSVAGGRATDELERQQLLRSITGEEAKQTTHLPAKHPKCVERSVLIRGNISSIKAVGKFTQSLNNNLPQNTGTSTDKGSASFWQLLHHCECSCFLDVPLKRRRCTPSASQS